MDGGEGGILTQGVEVLFDLLVDGFIDGTQWHAGAQQFRDKEEKEKEKYTHMYTHVLKGRRVIIANKLKLMASPIL